jgi:CrcB protein
LFRAAVGGVWHTAPAMWKILAIGAGGFLGAIARWGLSGLVQQAFGPAFPYGTLVVNVVGCFVLGAVAALIETGAILSPETRLFLTVGILGSFTTFSTLGFEAVEFLRVGSLRPAIAVLGANVALGLIAVWLGRAGARAWLA